MLLGTIVHYLLVLGMNFLNTRIQTMKENIDKFRYINIKNFIFKTVKKNTSQATNWERIFSRHITDK